MQEKILKNPVKQAIQKAVNNSTERLNFAVPFISSFALEVLNNDNTTALKNKRLVTRFEPNNVLTFDLPTLKKLLEFGFEIRYKNSIHLKLYIADEDAFVSSSNLTRGGFKHNIELTVMVDSSNVKSCAEIFDELWDSCAGKQVTEPLIELNLDKYELLGYFGQTMPLVSE